MNKKLIEYNDKFIKKVKSYSMALLFSIGMNEFLRGLSDDVLEPALDSIIPGDPSKPTNFYGMKLYLRRFLVKLLIFLVLIMFTYYMLKN